MHAMKDVYRVCEEDGVLIPCMRITPSGDPKTPSDRIHQAFCDLVAAMNERHGSKLSRFRALAEQLSAVQFDKRADDRLSTLTKMDAMHLSVEWSQTIHRRSPAAAQAHEPCMESETKTQALVFRKRRAIDPSLEGTYEVLTSGQPHPRFGKPLGPLLRAICDHPWPKGHRGSTWLAKAAEAHHHSTKFWQALRSIAYQESEINRPTDERYPALLRDLFSFDVSRDHLASVEAEHKQLEDEIQRLSDIATLKRAKSSKEADGLQSTWGTVAALDEPVEKKSTKVKTHRTTSEEELEALRVGLEENQVVDAEDEPTKPTKVHIAVKQDSLSVFNKIFCSAGSTSIRWIQLVQALIDAGMAASQVPGSGVKFTYGQGSVVFDKPHPEPVVNAVMLRRSVGRRLAKWFKWDLETFVLRIKEKEPDKAD